VATSNLPVGTIYLKDLHLRVEQEPGQPSPIGTSPLNSHTINTTERCQPTQQALIAGPSGRKRLDSQYSTVVIHRCHHMSVRVRVDATGHVYD
jgi:hypothetical protein